VFILAMCLATSSSVSAPECGKGRGWS